MNLKDIIDDKHKILKFIDSNFKYLLPDRVELRSQNHSLYLNEFNMVLKEPEKKFSFFNLSIRGLYAYLETKDQFCLYLLTDLNREKLSSFIHLIGFPENVLPADIESNDFDFLVWNKGDFDVILLKDRIRYDPGSPDTQCVFQIYNIKGTLLSDNRKLFNSDSSY